VNRFKAQGSFATNYRVDSAHPPFHDAEVSYLVLARKYRPQQFTDLIGQEHVARTLANAITLNRVHHAFLFTGARGIGKTSSARILAKALCCAQGPTATPCGTCSLCQSVATGQCVDVIEIDGASNNGVDEVRTLREGVRYAPSEARKKVYIIDEVHMLSTSAFNALLKTLEEPPSHVVFILATTEVHKIPATILSRCQRYDFKLLSTPILAAHLEKILNTEAIPFESAAIRLLAREAAGSVRDALSLLDQVLAYVGKDSITLSHVAEVLGVADRQTLFRMAQMILSKNVGESLRILSAAVDRGTDLVQLARSFLGLLHDLEIADLVPEATDILDATVEEIAEAKAMAVKAPRGLITSLFDRWARAVEDATRSQTPRLILEMALVDLCYAQPLLPLGDLLERLEGMEKRLANSGHTPSRPADPRPRLSLVNAPATSLPVPVTPSPPTAPKTPIPLSDTGAAGSDIAAVWRRVRESFSHKPALAAALEHAEVSSWEGGRVLLLFDEKMALDQTIKSRAEIDRSISQITGSVTKVDLQLGTSFAPRLLPSQVAQETQATVADQHLRETEARQHPMIRKTQELFGVLPKEIKTT
jgi:DNA polymerase-3 subunit gamma/tau